MLSLHLSILINTVVFNIKINFRQATAAAQAAGTNQDIFSRLGRPTPRLPFSLPLAQGLFPRTPFSINGDTSPPGVRVSAPGAPPGHPLPFPGFMHPFPGRPFPFPGGLPPHPFLPSFKNERDIDAGELPFSSTKVSNWQCKYF